MKLSQKNGVITSALGLLAALPLLTLLLGGSHFIDIATRIMIFAIAALSLDLILGFGGLVSFGHAGYLGIGAFSVGVLSYHGVGSGVLHLATAIGVSGLCALLIGLISLRTSGIHFIMITLAFGQMIYFLSTSVDTYGGEDGLNIKRNSDFFGLLDLGNPMTMYYVVFSCLVIILVLCERLIRSRFGRVLQGTRSNDRRMLALGYSTFRYKLAAYVISGSICGFSGFLLANQTLFVSPALAHWTRSAELMVMVILGGMGTLFGVILGTSVFMLLEAELSRITDHWQLIFGPILVFVILYAKGGIFGWITRARLWR